MRYAVSDGRVETLALSLESASGSARLHTLLALAWHLRQRDSLRAEQLLAEFWRWLPRHRLPLDQLNALSARAALTACETASLFCRFDDAQAWLDRARAHLNPSIDVYAEGDACLAEVLLRKLRGQRAEEISLLEQALRLFDALPDPQRRGVTRALLRSELGLYLANPGAEAESALAAGPLNDVDAPEQEDKAVQVYDLASRAFPLCLREPAEAAALFQASGALALEMGFLRFHCIAMMNASNALLELGDMEQAAQCFEAAAQRARQTQWPALMGMTQTQVGRVLRLLGRGQESLQALTEALAQLRAVPPGLITAFACAELAFSLRAVERTQESVDVMWEAIQLYRSGKHMCNLALSLARQAKSLAQLGQIEAALAALDESKALTEHYGYDTVKVDISEAMAEVHRRSRQQLPTPPEMTAPTATIHYAQTALDRGMGIDGWRPPPALLDYLAEAWAEADQDADHMAKAYAYARRARLAQRQESGMALKDSRPLLHLLGYQKADPLVASKPLELAQLQPSPHWTRQEPEASLLTPKEQEVLQLLARNYSNKEIAQSLGVSAETVKWHLKGLYGKLEAGSRRHAVTRARTLGMLGKLL
ncbi:LuxR C-terminal-related transcriptional regulator [Paucibacter sp. AS339]|uniref:LuxR C-terminal-related transcriptional regulator n=1 Tax=Paucibacter hankyongi TaxID=3133434 RepID=UPI0030A647A1